MNVLELTVNTGNKTDVSKATGKAYLHDRSNSGKEAWANLTECLILVEKSACACLRCAVSGC